ncbi:hypothetical protein MTO96_006847 [Rhipicephalus appendiculatus]
MVGLPGVVFLDEPYAGVDVLARTRIYIRLTGIKEQTKCSMVLTSHSMEECEVACDRICIMVQGTMVCLGTLHHLKEKFGKGCSIQFLLRDNANIQPHEILNALGKAFPGMTVLNSTEGLIEIRTREKLPWSVLFRNIESLDKDIGFERVLASDTTLEQLFIEFAEKAQNEKELLHNRVDLALVRKINSSYFDAVVRQPFDIGEEKLADVTVVYGPSNDRTDKLINKLLEKTNKKHLNQLIKGGRYRLL